MMKRTKMEHTYALICMFTKSTTLSDIGDISRRSFDKAVSAYRQLAASEKENNTVDNGMHKAPTIFY
jgi:hypothetical protein